MGEALGNETRARERSCGLRENQDAGRGGRECIDKMMGIFLEGLFFCSSFEGALKCVIYLRCVNMS